MDLQQAFDEGFDALKGYVDRSFDAYAARISALELRLNSLPAPKEYDPEAAARLAVGETVIPRMKAIEDGLPDVSAAVAPLLKRIEELEAREPLKGEDGKSITLEDVTPFINEEIGNLAHDLQRMIPREVETAVSGLPKPENGKDADPAEIERAVADAVAAIPPAQPGRDADPEEMRREIAEQVKAAVGALPVPENGRSVTVDDVRPLIEGHIAEQVAKAVAAIPVPVSVKAGFIDRDGRLVLTMSDGSLDLLGEVVGKNGADADWSKIDLRLKEMFDAWPKPKDGADGLGFKDLNLEFREEAAYFVYVGEEIQKEARLPIPYYRGVFREGNTYYKGNVVTWAGSSWIATSDEPSGKPDAPDSAWQLSNKKGKDGRDAEGRLPTKPVKAT